MKITGRMLFFVLALSAMAIAAAWHRTPEFTMSAAITTTGDTAQVMNLTPSTGLDSFVYFDSIDVGAQTASATRTRVQYVSPLQKIRIRVDSVRDNAAIKDTITIGGKTEISFTITTGSTVQKAVDSLVALINASTTVKDSITAQDSVTYVLLVARFSQLHLGTRFSVKTGDASGHVFTHSDTAWVTTVASVCDSLTAKFNASTAIKDTVTAVDSTTFVRIQSDIKGLAYRFIGASSGWADSTQDSTYVQLNVTSNSVTIDTFDLDPSYFGQTFDMRGLTGTINVFSGYTGHGWGNSDTATVQLVAFQGGSWYYIDSTRDALPLTWHLSYTGSTAGRDTLWKYGIGLIVRVQDSASDTTCTVPVFIKADYLLKDR